MCPSCHAANAWSRMLDTAEKTLWVNILCMMLFDRSGCVQKAVSGAKESKKPMKSGLKSARTPSESKSEAFVETPRTVSFADLPLQATGWWNQSVCLLYLMDLTCSGHSSIGVSTSVKWVVLVVLYSPITEDSGGLDVPKNEETCSERAESTRHELCQHFCL